MVNEQIFAAAKSCLKGKTVTDLVVGISLIAVELDHKYVGVAYTLRETLGGGCSIFPYASEAIGKSAEEVGSWFVNGSDDVQRGIGNAVLNAASQDLSLEDCGDKSHPFGIEVSRGDTVGMIGMIKPVVKMLEPTGCKFIIFDKGKSCGGNSGENIYPMSKQETLLPLCSVVFLSGTTTINNSIDGLLSMCKYARDIVMVGASTPMYPEGFKNTNVSILAGSWWQEKDKEDIFKAISLASGMQTLSKYMVKKNVRV